MFSNLHKTDRIVSRSKRLAADRLWFCIHGILHLLSRPPQGPGSLAEAAQNRQRLPRRNIVAVSRAVGDDLQQNLPIRPRRLAVINNPFDIDAIQQQAAAPCELAGQDYLVHVGRFHATKRHDRLLKAYAHSGIQAPLALIGTGDDARVAEVKRLATDLGIAERVLFLGFQANPYPFIRHASLLVLSSDSEGFVTCWWNRCCAARRWSALAARAALRKFWKSRHG